MKFDLEGRILATIGAHITASAPGPDDARFVNPFGVTAGRDGFLYVTDVGLHLVFKFTEDGNLVKNWGAGAQDQVSSTSRKVSQDEDGALCVVDFGNHRAQMMSPDGEYLGDFGISNASVVPLRP